MNNRNSFFNCRLAWLAVFAGTLAVGLPFYIPKAVRLEVRLGAPVPDGIQVYYRTMPEELFSEVRVIPVQPGGADAVANIAIPARQLCGLRIDFGSAPGEVSVLGGFIGDIPLPSWKYWSFSRDVTLKSDVGESGELRLFSDRADPYMAVAFRRPIPSRRTFNRQMFVLCLMLALVLAVATVRALQRRTDLCSADVPLDSRLPIKEIKMTPMSFLLFAIAAILLFMVGFSAAQVGLDMVFHIRSAYAIMAEHMSKPLAFWKSNPYPVWHSLVAAMMRAAGCNGRIAAGIVCGSCCVCFFVCLYVFLRHLIREAEPWHLIVASAVICTTGCIFGPGISSRQLYFDTPNTWHNPTSLMVRTMALPCLAYTSILLSQCIKSGYAKLQWGQVAILSLLLPLANLAKPSFAQVFLPAIALSCMYLAIRDRRALGMCLQIGVATVPLLLLMAAQFGVAFYSGMDGEGVGIGFMKVWGTIPNWRVHFLYGTAFPLGMLAYVIWRRRLDVLDAICWFSLIAGILEYAFLFEKGPRMMHGNFSWGVVLALSFVWVACVRHYVVLNISAIKGKDRLALWILTALLLAHVASGLFQLYRLLFLHKPS